MIPSTSYGATTVAVSSGNVANATCAATIAADPARLDQITTLAQKVADDMGKNFKIVRFSLREDIGEIKSRKAN